MFGHDNRELAAVFAGGALGTLARADAQRWSSRTMAERLLSVYLAAIARGRGGRFARSTGTPGGGAVARRGRQVA